ncbi:MAG: thiamine pyrophosphate-binding protein [Akkermansiaceae bacterium]|nr:thiamine pyrophosphate-binding protein [Akkermansiaceae bacterium]
MNGWQQALNSIQQCLAAGIHEFVVCSGARNALLLEAIARAEAAGKVRVWNHFEERSAGFFALGRCMQSGEPCAVVTTSGTAVAELLPAVIEAHYQGRPLVALTADRPEVFRGTGAPQTLVQPDIFGSHAQTQLESWDGLGPLHLNIELEEATDFGEEDFSDVEVGDFEPTRPKPGVAELARWLREDRYRGLVVMVGGLEPEERENVFHFCLELGVPLIAESTSGLREALQELAIQDATRVLRKKPPGKLLRLGDVPSNRSWRDLDEHEALQGVEVWSICRTGLPGLARSSEVTRGPVHRIIAALGEIDPGDDALDHLVDCARHDSRIEELLEAYPDSEPGLVRALSIQAAIGNGVFLGNSLPIREWNEFAQWERPVPEVRANRGVNGIDGQVSTWLGWSADESESWAIVGDLTALYDVASGFVLEQVAREGRVLAVINNRGGRIFDRLARLQAMSPRAREWMANAQQADLGGIAKLWGMQHQLVRCIDDLDEIAAAAGKAILLEVCPDARQTEQFWKAVDGF